MSEPLTEDEIKFLGLEMSDLPLPNVVEYRQLRRRAAAEIRRLRADKEWLIGQWQHLQPGGSPPSGDFHILVVWIRRRVSDELNRLRAQLPDGMKHCTIRAKSCRLGHAWLTADNWVQHGCPTCEELKLRAELAAANAMADRLADDLRWWTKEHRCCGDSKALAAYDAAKVKP